MSLGIRFAQDNSPCENVFNHPNFGLPSVVLAGIPGKASTQMIG